MAQNKISEMLDGVACYPFHMPGHKRNTALTGGDFPYNRDITEIAGSDNLHDASGVILAECERAARLWGAARAHLLVNGSTCGILAAIRAYAGHDRGVVVARNCHKSVYHGIELCRLQPTYIYPAIDPESGICASITPAEVESALAKAPDAKLVIVTSPTYEGVISDIAGIAAVAHALGALLLVDAAHGAHLIYQTESFPENAIKYADIAVTSLHKTMPALTQTALALVYNGELESDMAAAIDIFETSSPSYILLSSIDECIYVAEQGAALFEEWSRRLGRFYSSLSSLENLKILPASKGMYALDRSKICLGFERLSLDGRDFTARDFGRALRDGGFEPEMIAYNYAVLMTGCFVSFIPHF